MEAQDNANEQTEGRALAEVAPAGRFLARDNIVIGKGAVAFQNIGEVVEYAKLMSKAGPAVPAHLRMEPGACLAVIDDSIRFGLSPFFCARRSYFVNNAMAYEAQVFAAALNHALPLKRRPVYTYQGDGDERICKVTLELLTGETITHDSPKLKLIHPKNSTLWKSDPDQQQGYYTIRACARRNFPDVLAGAYDLDEVLSFARDITPPRREGGIAERLAARSAAGGEGFSEVNVERELSGVGEGAESTDRATGDPDGAVEQGSSAAGSNPAVDDGKKGEPEAKADPLAEFAEAIAEAGSPALLRATQGEFQDWISSLSEEDRARAKALGDARLSEMAKKQAKPGGRKLV